MAVISEGNRGRLAGAICDIARQRGAEEIVLGLPRNMNGSEGESALYAREFGALLEKKSGLPVVMRDERGTTITATGYLNVTDVRGKARKKTVDAVAATIILQDYLDYRKNFNQ